MAYKITDKCISCGACAGACPVTCISQGDERYVIDSEQCISCGTCAGICPVGSFYMKISFSHYFIIRFFYSLC